MNFKQLWNQVVFSFQDGHVLTVGHLVSAGIVLLLGLLMSTWISRLVHRRMKRSRLSPDTALTLRRLVLIFLLITTVLTTMGLLGVPISTFTFMSGAVAIGVGFGAQNIINNYISGWILMSERPVRIGDIIEIDNERGVVELIGNRCTQIRRVDGVHMMVPNSQLMERKLINWTLIDKQIRSTITVGVAYGSPVRDVERLINQAVKEHPQVLDEPEVVVTFSDFGDSALIFETFFWCEISAERQLRQIRSDIRFRIDELFREADIVIAFPQRDLHLVSTPVMDVRMIDHAD